MPKDKPIQNIALLNFGGIGDEILFSPVIHALKNVYPESQLSLILESRSRVVHSILPEIKTIIAIEVQEQPKASLFWQLLKLLRVEKYDAVISSGSSPFIALLLGLSGIPIRVGFQSSLISKLLLTHQAPLYHNKYAGAMYFELAKAFLTGQSFYISQPEESIPTITASDTAIKAGEQLYKEADPTGKRPRILIHPGVSQVSIAKNILKSWPLAYWQQLITQLLERYPSAIIAFSGGPDDIAVIESLEVYRQSLAPSVQERVVNFYGKTAHFSDLAGLIACSNLLISVDSAPLHLAVGLKIPVVSIFGPTNDYKLIPESPLVIACSRNELPCRPCLWDVRQTSCDTPICLEVPVTQVLEAVQQLLPIPSSVTL